MRRTSSTLMINASTPDTGVVLGVADVPRCEHAAIATAAQHTMKADLSRLARGSTVLRVEPVGLIVDSRFLRTAARGRSCRGCQYPRTSASLAQRASRRPRPAWL